ncbi:MAG: acyl-CoA synthetase [Sciscionella sp.]
MDILSRIPHQLGRVPDVARSLEVLRKAGLFDPLRPHVGIQSLMLAKRWGPFAGSVMISARRDSRAVGLIDERGELTFTQLEQRSNSLARAFQERGLGQGSVIAVLCRDHRGMVDTMLASAKIGAQLLLMNTGFGKQQLTAVAEREGVEALVYDQEFTEWLQGIPDTIPRYLAWVDDAAAAAEVTKLDELITSASDRPLPAPQHAGGFILLTSGTTGTPKGAPREVKSGLSAAEFLDRIPLRTGESTFLGAPVFHATGLSQFVLSFALGSAVVMRRRFDPEEALRCIDRHRCTALVLVPTMLQRILNLGEDAIAKYDTSSLRIVFCAGSALPPEVGNHATKIFGDVIHNLYGSTEVAVVAVATPQDWKQAPGTVGRAPVGCKVRLYDKDGQRITTPDTTGRVFGSSGLAFGGYTGGGSKVEIDGLLSSGDVGHFDAEGLLFIDGRDDDMIVSGGENVYPIEIENLLVEHEKVLDAAVIGVEDQDFGQRLKAFVVLRDGTAADSDELKEYVRCNLARYKVPREFSFLDELPRNATGKLLRSRLR